MTRYIAPSGNKLCAQRALQRRQDAHRDRVLSVRPSVDTSKPLASHLDHVRNNLKREQRLEERYCEIDRENRILLQKMSGIMATTSAQKPEAIHRPPGMSLNRDARKKELLRITKENQHILRRIQQAQPVYNHVEQEGYYKQAQTYLRNCAEYPLVLRTPRSARGRLNGSSALVPLEHDLQEHPQSARDGRRRGTNSAHSDGSGRRRGGSKVEDSDLRHEDFAGEAELDADAMMMYQGRTHRGF